MVCASPASNAALCLQEAPERLAVLRRRGGLNYPQTSSMPLGSQTSACIRIPGVEGC